jgi:hypothetical protein
MCSPVRNAFTSAQHMAHSDWLLAYKYLRSLFIWNQRWNSDTSIRFAVHVGAAKQMIRRHHHPRQATTMNGRHHSFGRSALFVIWVSKETPTKQSGYIRNWKETNVVSIAFYWKK